MNTSIIRSPLLLLTTAVLTAIVLSGCGSDAATPEAGHAPPPPEVSVATVVAKPVREWNEFTGRVAAIETVALSSRVSGYVEEVRFREGQDVAKGDVLFVIDQRRYRADVEQARAELERARSEAELARSQDVRAQSLIDQRAISREEFDQRKAQTTQARAAVRAAEAALARAQLDLDYTEVRSPISGRAGRALVTVGNMAQADQTQLTTVVSQNPVHVYFEGDEQAYLKLAREARAQGGVEGSRVRIGLADEQGYPHEGQLDFLDNQVDARTGTIRARAVVDNSDGTFTPGLFARVQLEAQVERNALLIDPKAVLTDQDRTYVYVLGADNTAMRKDIRLGREIDDLRVVDAGLSATDQVIVHGVQKVFFPGMTVVPVIIAMGAAPGVVALAATAAQ